MERVDLCFNDPNEVIETKTKLIRINKNYWHLIILFLYYVPEHTSDAGIIKVRSWLYHGYK